MLVRENVSTAEKRLLEAYKSMPEEDRRMLCEFAEFLLQRNKAAPEPLTEMKPNPAPRPEKESVVGAIKRLSMGYPMLESNRLFHETSTLMTQHVMQGRPAREVIDELEALFEKQYQQMISAAQ